MRERGVLIGLTGPRGDVLKIRPPLAFGLEHVPVLADALDGALAQSRRSTRSSSSRASAATPSASSR